MTDFVPRSLIEEESQELAIDAVYFAVRILRNSQRGYKELTASTESDEPVQDLTRRAVAEIEACEGRAILELEEARVDEYINALEAFSSARSSGKNEPEGTGTTILEELRDLPI